MSGKGSRSLFTKYLFRGGKIVIAVELTCFVASYLGWRHLNHNQDTRYYLYRNQPVILEAYYKFGEQISSECKVRDYDMVTWKGEGKL